MADFSSLQAAVDAAVQAAANEQTVADSVVAFIQSQAAATQQAISDAITANDALDNSAIAVANQAVQNVADGMVARIGQLSSAITTSAPPIPGAAAKRR